MTIKSLFSILFLSISFLFSQVLSEMDERKITENLKDGVHIEYYDNGQPRFQMSIKNGQLHGPMISYDKDKRIRLSKNYEYGKKHGLELSYYEGTEQIFWSQMWKYGESHGTSTWYREDGHIIGQWNYKDGKLHGPTISYLGSEIEYQGSYKDGEKHGNWIDYFDNGNIQTTENYKDGKLHGPYSSYWEDTNTIMLKQEYVNDQLHGVSSFYSESGILLLKGMYKNGRRDGVHKYYNILNGELEQEVTYRFDIEIESKKY